MTDTSAKRNPLVIATAMVLGLLLAVELGIRVSGLDRQILLNDIIDIQSEDVLAAKLEAIRAHDGPVVVVLGDSVPYGRTMLEYGDRNWRDHTVDVYLENALSERFGHRDAEVVNLSMNGAVPRDMERVGLAAISAGADMIILDASIRSFSEDFAAPDNQFSRGWLRSFEQAEAGLDFHIWRLFGLREIFQWRYLNNSIDGRISGLRDEVNAQLLSAEESNAQLLNVLRARSRYSTANFLATNPQVQSLDRLLRAAEREGLPAVVFYATENPSQRPQIIEDAVYDELMPQLRDIVESTGSIFVPAMADIDASRFLDQVHLDSEGYRLLSEHIISSLPEGALDALSDLEAEPSSLASLLQRYGPIQPDTALVQEVLPLTVHDGDYVAMVDAAAPYNKSGLMEAYGLAVNPVREGPITISGLDLHQSDTQALLRWTPEIPSTLGSASRLFVDLDANGNDVAYIIGVVLEGETLVWAANDSISPQEFDTLGDYQFIQQSLGEDESSFSLSAFSGRAVTGFVLALSQTEVAEFDAGELSLDPLKLKALGIKPEDDIAVPSDSAPYLVTGLVQGHRLGGEVTVRDERGEVVAVGQPNTTGGFAISFESQARLLSIAYTNPEGEHFYSEYGRWADIRPGLASLTINATQDPTVGISFNDPDAMASFVVNPSRRRPEIWQGPRNPHSIAQYIGYRNVTREYSARTFTNNLGFLDRDRFFEASNCPRVLWVGTSGVEALQATIPDRHNILLEEELGIQLGRCVDVMAAAPSISIRDYEIVSALLERFEPEYFMFFTNNSDFLLLSPEMHELARGWDREHSAAAMFVRTDNGLEFRDSDLNYGAFVTDSQRTLSNGITTFSSVMAEWDSLHPQAQQVFDYFDDVADFYAEAHPDVQFIVEVTTNQAVCSTTNAFSCSRGALTNDRGERYQVNTVAFLDNINRACAETPFICLAPDVPDVQGDPYPRLMWVFDSHFTRRGHQWVARSHADALASELAQP